MAVSEEKYQAALRRLRNLRQSGEAALMTGVEAVEVVGAGSAFSFADGYFGKPHVHPDAAIPPSVGIYWFGVPYQMYAGAAFHLVGALGLASEHMHALGNGAFSSGAGRMSYEAGLHARVVADTKQPLTTAAGSRIPLTMTAGRRSYTDAELDRIARSAT